jgi:Zn-dependent metalloprotease
MHNSDDPSELPGKPVRYENSTDIKDKNVDTSYKNTGLVYDFYDEVFGRNSIDGQGMTLVSSCHFGVDYDNAFWQGTQMVYGDGSGMFLKKGSLTALDVTAHELQHGVTQYATPSGLDYNNQSGGLNESWSDCFGIMCLQWNNKQKADSSSWLIGEGMMVQGDALRSMKAPGTANPDDEQIANANEYQDGMDPHISSGPPNRAFYLACTKLGGYSWEKIGKAWYVALPRLPRTATYQMAADNIFEVTGSLFGEGGKEQKAVHDAWHEVGVEAKKPDLSMLVSSSRTHRKSSGGK